MRIRHSLLAMVVAGFVSACGGGGSGGGAQGQGDGGNGGSGGGSPIGEPDVFFEQRLQTAVAFCRTCHIPGAVADSDEGRRFMLSSNPSNDYDLLYASWQALGGGVDSSLILIEASDDSEPHSGCLLYTSPSPRDRG